MMIDYFIPAFVLGLIAGLKPGPLNVVIMQETLKHGLYNGVKASFAPLITDAPIILMSLYILQKMGDITIVIAAISIIGALFLLHTAIKIFKIRQFSIVSSEDKVNSLGTAIKTNLLNPNPYLFWFTVGGSYIALATNTQTLVFVLTTTLTLVLTKMCIAWLTSYYKKIFEKSAYIYTLWFLATILIVFSISLFYRAYQLLI